MSKFDAAVGLGARDSDRRPAARTESALSIGPCFSLVEPGGGDSLLPGCCALAPAKDDVLELNCEEVVPDTLPNHTNRRGGENGMVIKERKAYASGVAGGAGKDEGNDLNTRRRGGKLLR